MAEAVKRGRIMTPAQCRAARALLNWTQMRLAQHARVVRMTVTMFESGGTVRASTRRRIQAACEEAGVEFIWSEADGGEGVMR